MRITHLQVTPYHIPFAASFVTAHGRATAREGLILRLSTDAGVVGLGEAAPLPEFGGGTVADAAALLADLTPALTGVTLSALLDRLAALPLDRPGAAAVRCGLETAALDALGRARGVPLAALLAPDHADTVPLNATVGAPGADAAAAAARRAVAEGFATIKLKVGVAGSAAAELARVAAVRAAVGPGVALRLDANGAWQPNQAIALLRRLAAYDLDLVEQPVPAGDLAGLARVRRAVDVPLAADESATTLAAVRALLRAEAVDAIVVKPMVAGGPRAARTIIEAALDAGLRAIVTTTLDAGIGVAAALHVAATLPAPIPACGLATGALLATDLLQHPLPIARGWMAVPEGGGVGVDLEAMTSVLRIPYCVIRERM